MANMACVITYSETRTVKQVRFVWLSDDAAGTVAGTTKTLSGQLIGVEFINNSAAPPDNLYDLTILNEDGFDVLCGVGANIPVAANQFYAPVILNGAGGLIGSAVPIDSALTLAIAAAGNANAGTTVLYLR